MLNLEVWINPNLNLSLCPWEMAFWILIYERVTSTLGTRSCGSIQGRWRSVFRAARSESCCWKLPADHYSLPACPSLLRAGNLTDALPARPARGHSCLPGMATHASSLVQGRGEGCQGQRSGTRGFQDRGMIRVTGQFVSA